MLHRQERNTPTRPAAQAIQIVHAIRRNVTAHSTGRIDERTFEARVDRLLTQAENAGVDVFMAVVDRVNGL